MDIFANAEVGVETYATRRSDRPIDTVSDVTISNIALREHAEKEAQEKFDRELMKIEEESRRKDLQEAVIRRTLYESQIEHKMAELSNEGRDLIFKDMVFEVFSNALLLDDYFVKENTDALRSLVNNFIDENGGYKMLAEACEKNDIPMLNNMKRACNKIVMEACKKTIANSKESDTTDGLDFSLDDEDSDKLDYAKKDLSLADVADLVKDKVLTVVKDEKEKEEAESELVSQIEEELSENEDVEDEESLDEAFHRVVIDNTNVEETTLFNALLRNSLNEMIAENVSIMSADGPDDYYDREVDNELDCDDCEDIDPIDELDNPDDSWEDIDDINNEFDPEISLREFAEDSSYDQGYNSDYTDPKESGEFDPVEEFDADAKMHAYRKKHVMKGKGSVTNSTGEPGEGTNHLSENKPVMAKENAINMDMVMAEAITKYTLMETFYTLGLKDYSHDDVRKISNNYLNESFEPKMDVLSESTTNDVMSILEESDIVSVVNSLPNVKSVKGASDNAISTAEGKLGLRFAPEYKTYLKHFGTATANNVHLTGTVMDAHKNVVKATELERQLNHNIPSDMYVVELDGPDGVITLQDESGAIYQAMPQGAPHMIAGSLAEYLEQDVLGVLESWGIPVKEAYMQSMDMILKIISTVKPKIKEAKKLAKQGNKAGSKKLLGEVKKELLNLKKEAKKLPDDSNWDRIGILLFGIGSFTIGQFATIPFLANVGATLHHNQNQSESLKATNRAAVLDYIDSIIHDVDKIMSKL